MATSARSWIKRIVLIATGFVILAVGGVVVLLPAAAGYACPSCYGLERVAGQLFVEHAMSVEDRTTIQEIIARAAAQVADFYGAFDQLPTILACATEECDRSLEEGEQERMRTARHSSGCHRVASIRQYWRMSSRMWTCTRGSGPCGC